MLPSNTARSSRLLLARPNSLIQPWRSSRANESDARDWISSATLSRGLTTRASMFATNGRLRHLSVSLRESKFIQGFSSSSLMRQMDAVYLNFSASTTGVLSAVHARNLSWSAKQHLQLAAADESDDQVLIRPPNQAKFEQIPLEELTGTPRRRASSRSMPFIENLPLAWGERTALFRSRNMRPDDGTIASAWRIYYRELQRRCRMVRFKNFTAEDLAHADAAVQKARRIFNSRLNDPSNAQELAERTAKLGARKASARPKGKIIVLQDDESALQDRRLYPQWNSRPSDDTSLAAAHAALNRAVLKLKRARAASHDAARLAPLEAAVEAAKAQRRESYRDPSNAEERKALRVYARAKAAEYRAKDPQSNRRKAAERRAREREREGLPPARPPVGLGVVSAMRAYAASQGKQLPSLGTDDGSVFAAFRLHARACARLRALRYKGAATEEVAIAEATRNEKLALFNSRLHDPVNAAEKQIFVARRSKSHKRQDTKGWSYPTAAFARVQEKIRQELSTGGGLTNEGNIYQADRVRAKAQKWYAMAKRGGANETILKTLEEHLLHARDVYKQRFRDPQHALEAEEIRQKREARPSAARRRAKHGADKSPNQ